MSPCTIAYPNINYLSTKSLIEQVDFFSDEDVDDDETCFILNKNTDIVYIFILLFLQSTYKDIASDGHIIQSPCQRFSVLTTYIFITKIYSSWII